MLICGFKRAAAAVVKESGRALYIRTEWHQTFENSLEAVQAALYRPLYFVIVFPLVMGKTPQSGTFTCLSLPHPCSTGHSADTVPAHLHAANPHETLTKPLLNENPEYNPRGGAGTPIPAGSHRGDPAPLFPIGSDRRGPKPAPGADPGPGREREPGRIRGLGRAQRCPRRHHRAPQPPSPPPPARLRPPWPRCTPRPAAPRRSPTPGGSWPSW